MLNCKECKHKQNGLLHCSFYINEPDICFMFEEIFDNNIIIDQLIKRKTNDLVNSFQKLEYTYHEWYNIIKDLLRNIDTNNLELTTRFIRSFGDNGLTFACNKCGNIVELEDDTSAVCSQCRSSDLSFISI